MSTPGPVPIEDRWILREVVVRDDGIVGKATITLERVGMKQPLKDLAFGAFYGLVSLDRHGVPRPGDAP